MSYETEDKMVSHPDHYKSGKYEVIEIIDEFCKDLVGTECVCTANALKYILRWKKKNGIQDVKKAIWYLQHMVDIYEYAERDEKIVAETIEESFPTLKEVLCNPWTSYDTYHAEDYTSGSGMKISEQMKKSLASQGFKKIIIHHMDGHSSNEVIDISEFAPDAKKGIDDEPEPLNLRKNAAGVYIPEDHIKKDCRNCKYESAPIDSIHCSECVDDGMSGSPTKWEPKDDIMNPPYEVLMRENEYLKQQLADANADIKFLEDDLCRMSDSKDEEVKKHKKINAGLTNENSNLKFDLSEIASIMLKFLAQTDMKLAGYQVGDTKEKEIIDISHECRDIATKIHKYLAKYEMED